MAQLAEWGRRVDVPVVTGPEKSDPASVVFDGMERAIAENIDVLMIDTAGRLQNKDNLMAELEKSAGLSSGWCLMHRMKPCWPSMHQPVKMPWCKPKNFQKLPCDRNCIDQDRWNGSRWGRPCDP